MVFISKGGDKHNSNDLGRCKVDATPSFASTIVDKSKLYLDDASRLGGDGAGAGAHRGDAAGVQQPRHGRHGAPALVLLEHRAGPGVVGGSGGEESTHQTPNGQSHAIARVKREKIRTIFFRASVNFATPRTGTHLFYF